MLNKNRWIQKDIVYKGKNKHINLARNIIFWGVENDFSCLIWLDRLFKIHRTYHSRSM